MALCVGCKACKRECPTGVDMARMKIELTARWREREGLAWRDRLIAGLPRLAPRLARFAPLLAIRERFAACSGSSASVSSASPPSAACRGSIGAARRQGQGTRAARASSSSRTRSPPGSSPRTASAARAVLEAMGYRVIDAAPSGERPLCCGRTYLAAGMVDDARAELRRTIAHLRPHLDAGLPVVGLEPSCLFTFKDELLGAPAGSRAPRARCAGGALRRAGCR
jgi:Fe-S oxidoreductase